ncbi:MAG: SPOR domain-containing protein [Bacteroidales bacterium]|nr:SPOR domain-containing protein [Bacteroidales bacterium]
MRIIPFIMLWLLVVTTYGQAGLNTPADTTSLEVSVRQNPQIEQLMRAHKEVVSRERGINGFRVQIYSDSGNQSKLRTQRRQADFDAKYPGVASYVVYDAPDFKLRVGDFRTRLDARRFLEKIARDYEGAYIVVDMINYPGFD